MWSLVVETMSNIIKDLYPKGGDKMMNLKHTRNARKEIENANWANNLNGRARHGIWPVVKYFYAIGAGEKADYRDG